MRPSPLIAAPLLPAALAAQPSSPRTVDTVKVIGRVDAPVGTARSASDGRVGRVDLQARPIADVNFLVLELVDQLDYALGVRGDAYTFDVSSDTPALLLLALATLAT